MTSLEDELIDVSSEDETETSSFTQVVNKMVAKLKECPQEKLDELKKVNEELIDNCQKLTDN